VRNRQDRDDSCALGFPFHGDERAADPCARRIRLPRSGGWSSAICAFCATLSQCSCPWPSKSHLAPSASGSGNASRAGTSSQFQASNSVSVNAPAAAVREAIVSEMHRGLTVMLPAESSGSNLTLGTALGVRSGWKPHVRTRSLRELSDCSATVGTAARNIRCF
jgi:hypothetical protein